MKIIDVENVSGMMTKEMSEGLPIVEKKAENWDKIVEQLKSQDIKPYASNFFMKIAIVLGVLAIFYGAFLNWDHFVSFHNEMKTIGWLNGFLVVGSVFVAVNLAALVWRIVLVLFYKPVASCSDEELPTCTVIVPAYNEGKLVLSTLKSIAASNYPQEKLQILAVDDGSVDDTWAWMCKAKDELGACVTLIKQPKNMGKRHALYAGFKQSTGEVIVTVDSDSIIVADTLRNMTSPFQKNEKVGAIAGNVRVLNMNKGPLPRMLEVIFVYSFDFIRASQSMVNTVMCTPGALSGYRKSVVDKVVDEWVAQTFCGQPANIGEDRAMTNLILRAGYHVHFQQNAMVYTDVPVRFKNLCKMYLRWDRSNIRETLVMCRFAFRRFRSDSMLGARINLLLSVLSLTKGQLFMFFTLGLMIWRPVDVGLNIVFGTVLFSFLPVFLYWWKYKNSDCLWSFAYGILWFISLAWIVPYAMVTPHHSGWLTRDKVATPAKEHGAEEIKEPCVEQQTSPFLA